MENISFPAVSANRPLVSSPPASLAPHDAIALKINPVSANSPRIQAALSHLRDAAAFALDVGSDIWEFAVEISVLRRLGLTRSECRWLIAKGLVTHARESSSLDGERRVFRQCVNLSFPRRTCFVITPAGVSSLTTDVRSTPRRNLNGHHERRNGEHNGNGDANGHDLDLPLWDPDRQQLRIGRTIVKQFKVPAANQEAVLAAFEEEGWPPRIDDPLPPKQNQDPKRRLHDTINSLNRNQRQFLIRFLGDGSGQGIRWEFAGTQPGENGGATSAAAS